ncbi:type II secretion system protein GspM [uncultured Tateyamaria sp.]|uniref:type II secretion system protein GspM n=1 Tax=uncultured Tateyamaria sp. TaxID=455651 RepID=UPI00263039FC|nr:type II secretion system protein GspM [uncultured Tateyamaria sp.]
MSARLIDLLSRLAPRERLLLAIMLGVALPAGLIFGLLLPLHDTRNAALDDRSDALALNLWVQARVVELQGLPQPEETIVTAPIGTSGIEQALIERGLRDAVSQLSADSQGVVTLRFDEVRFGRLADWLSEAHPRWGYDIAALRLDAADTEGSVAAALTLVAPDG